ncbi:phage head closure protein [Pseudomonas umsongensis]|uniref:phage head closure protein n=1 Tax=Pseudomonas umsongensis TaxID=198618 RepID=UPI00200B45D2|nr:phage head closure protein [Pseudomonas umsongensis]MCK8685362.1 phage head closure protein [Pseudomonas umsongensis]
MRAGSLKHRCGLLQSQEVKRPGGGVNESWVELVKLWAEITIPTGRIATVADQLQRVVSAEIRIRHRADVVAGMRLVHKTKTYLIEASLPDNDQTMLRLLCSSVTNP